jgi:mono/diheme cytochrome c family protein
MRALTLVACLLGSTVLIAAQQRTTDAGVYTAAQAARGAALFGSQCATCHRDGGSAPSLAGERFTTLFADGPLSTIFTTIKTTMPRMAPGSLTDAQYLDIVTYLLRANGYPDGMTELAAADLEAVTIPGQSGSLDFALIQVVGCLSRTSNRWMLSQATEPSRTREPEPARDDEAARLDQSPIGTRTFRLQQVYAAPAGWTNQKVAAKGFLTRAGSEDRLTITSLRPLTSACPN